MDTFVVRITPRRIERLLFLTVILLFMFTTFHYANKYYDTTTEDKGYLDKILSGTFFVEVPSGEKVSAETETAPEEEEPPATIVTEEETVPPEPEPEAQAQIHVQSEACISTDFKVTGFDTEKVDEDSSKEGIIEKISLSFCNLDDDDENYLIAEVYFWDEADEDNNIVTTRKTIPWFTAPQTVFLEPGERYTKTYKMSKARSIWRDPRFDYMVKFYYVDQAGEKTETTAVKSVSGKYTIN